MVTDRQHHGPRAASSRLPTRRSVSTSSRSWELRWRRLRSTGDSPRVEDGLRERIVPKDGAQLGRGLVGQVRIEEVNPQEARSLRLLPPRARPGDGRAARALRRVRRVVGLEARVQPNPRA